jgi:DNA (cytosine-5)-methyltransferase 1
MKPLTFVSLFAGVGGFDLGFERAGIECIGQVERDKRAREVLDARFPDIPKHDDVQTAERWAHEQGLVGRTDIVCGGFPCQDVSVAGRRAGLAGSRSGLFWDALSFAQTVEARWLVLENVPGLLSSNEGRDFGVVLSALSDAGYSHIEWRVLDSQFFGVPQRRRRVFIVACTRDIGRRQVLTESESVRRYFAESKPTGTITTTAITSSLGTGGPDDNQAQGNQLVPYVKSRRAQSDEDYETWIDRPISPTLNAFDNTTESRATVLAFYSTGGGNDAPVEDLSPTVKVGSSGSCAPVAIAQEQAVRRLTPTECERLQGFPDGWTDMVADSHRYRQMGNAVTVNVANYVGDCIRVSDSHISESSLQSKPKGA